MSKLDGVFDRIIAGAWILLACCSAPDSGALASEVHITILHVNDLYEITSVGGGKRGGFARVTTLRKQLQAKNPNTFVFFCGDLYSPSGLGNAVVNGEALSGRQAVAALNEVGIDYMTFGDHEFHIPPDQFYRRLAETEYRMVSSNVFDEEGQPHPGVAVNAILSAENREGDQVTIGLFGLTESFTSPIPVKYVEPLVAAEKQVKKLVDKVDILIALTHFDRSIDLELARQQPEIDLILGGDDHEHMKLEQPGLATVYKSDSNARSVHVLDLYFDSETKRLRIEDQLIEVNDSIVEDPRTLEVVNYWKELAFAGFRASGMDPDKSLGTTPIKLDGLASSIRNRPTELTKIITKGMLQSGDASGAEVSYCVTGILRLDDIIPAGSEVFQYDVVRALPFEIGLVTVIMSGEKLAGALDTGRTRKGTGAFVMSAGASWDSTKSVWLINGDPIDSERSYRVVTMGPASPELELVSENGTLKEAFVAELERTFR
ncbi:bifunctional metallophosphatase/5'-nucleotidase [bacterium]|jgi:5'-nucleotidase / UDP-sugar diphosphatase|nr:bifunctional metallophosphatase/5'-nucleotidase [bacterium]